MEYRGLLSMPEFIPSASLQQLSNDGVNFIKKSSIISYSREALQKVHKDIESFAKAEQLTAHANSIHVRFEEED